MRRLTAPISIALALACATCCANAQPSEAPVPLYPASPPPPEAPATIHPEPLPSLTAPPQDAPSAAAAPDTAVSSQARVFCGQSVTVHIADPDGVPPRYREFVGMFSDAAWTPQLCAALVVESVSGDGMARIVYAFGPNGSSSRAAGGVLHGTGIVKDGALLFQNGDGSQFAFRPLYGDLDGRLTTPQGQGYRAVFKKTL